MVDDAAGSSPAAAAAAAVCVICCGAGKTDGCQLLCKDYDGSMCPRLLYVACTLSKKNRYTGQIQGFKPHLSRGRAAALGM